MAKEKLILVPSKRMDENKKEGRNENGLVRMSKAAREYMSFSEDNVEIYPNSGETSKRMNNSMFLEIFQAFSGDLSKLKSEGFSRQELCRVGFVTTKTYKKITGSDVTNITEDVWVSDSIYDTVIGADPEFLLFDKEGEIVSANNVLGFHGPIGCDGAMAEIRPHPAITPEGIVEHIRKLLDNKELVARIEVLDWMSGCYYKDNRRDYPVGGHIHIGNPVQISKISMDNRMLFFRSFNKILDTYVSVPMIKIDGTELGRARRTECRMGKYGYFGEFRPCNGRLEHRTLSGLWLSHPELTLAVMGTAKAVIDEVFKYVAHNKFDLEYMYPSKLKGISIWSPQFNGWEEIPLCKDLECVESSAEMTELLHGSQASRITLKYLKDWYDKIRKLSTYKQYATYIDNLYSILKTNSKTLLKIDRNIKSGWLEGKPFLK